MLLLSSHQHFPHVSVPHLIPSPRSSFHVLTSLVLKGGMMASAVFGGSFAAGMSSRNGAVAPGKSCRGLGLSCVCLFVCGLRHPPPLPIPAVEPRTYDCFPFQAEFNRNLLIFPFSTSLQTPPHQCKPPSSTCLVVKVAWVTGAPPWVRGKATWSRSSRSARPRTMYVQREDKHGESKYTGCIHINLEM